MTNSPIGPPRSAVELFGGPFDGQVIELPGKPESISLIETKVPRPGADPVEVAHAYRRRRGEGVSELARSGAYAMDWCGVVGP